MKAPSLFRIFAVVGVSSVASLAPLQSLHAQMTCTGAACAALPLNNAQLTSISDAIQGQYLNKVVEDMATATVMAGSHISPSGVVNLREFTVGASLAAAATQQRKLSVAVPNYGVLQDMPSQGVAAVPRAFVGFNVGYLFSGEPQQWDGLGFLSPYRFDVYVSGLNGSMNDLKDMVKTKGNLDWTASSRALGGELRYHLIEGGDRDSMLFAFTGVSLGLGYSYVAQDVTVDQKNSKVKINAGGGTNIIWNAENTLHYRSRADVYPLTLRTGVQLLYFLRLSVGGGVAVAKGSADVVVERYGRAYLDNDLAAVLGTTLPDAMLGLRLKGSGAPPEPRYTFMTAGLEFNIPLVKLFVDVQGNKKETSGAVGVRMVF